MFELRVEPPPASLAALGQVVELRELPYSQMRAAMAASQEAGQSAERLLAATLHVDGAAIGYEALQVLPGRFAGGIQAALQQCIAMYDLHSAPAADEAPKA